MRIINTSNIRVGHTLMRALVINPRAQSLIQAGKAGFRYIIASYVAARVSFSNGGRPTMSSNVRTPIA